MRYILIAAAAASLAACAATPSTSHHHTGHEHPHGGHDHAETSTRIEPLAPLADGEPTPWTSLEALDDAARFHFAVIGDRTGGEREGVFEHAMTRINLVQPGFVVSVGDLIEGYTEDRDQLSAEWNEADEFIGILDAPFFYVPGNHDYSNQVMADVWAERYGPDHYAFTYQDTLFIVLNSALFDRSDVSGHGQRRGDWEGEQAAQLAWLADTLDTHREVRWTVMFMHRPYWRDGWLWDEETETYSVEGPWPRHQNSQSAEWLHVADLLADRDYTFFAGHMHTYEFESDNEGGHVHDRIAMATTGGINNQRGANYGEFDHFIWVTMTEDGPVIANLLLEGILDKDFVPPYQRPWWIGRDPSDPVQDPVEDESSSAAEE